MWRLISPDETPFDLSTFRADRAGKFPDLRLRCVHTRLGRLGPIVHAAHLTALCNVGREHRVGIIVDRAALLALNSPLAIVFLAPSQQYLCTGARGGSKGAALFVVVHDHVPHHVVDVVHASPEALRRAHETSMRSFKAIELV